jgi:MFS superfamily sulfate permease-like transporter
MVDSAGGRTQVAGLTAAAVVAIVLLFLTGPLAYMPNAVLAAVVFLIGIRLIDILGMRDILRLRPGEFAVAAITAAVVVVVGVEQGIVLAMALSILEHLYHLYRPFDRLLVPADGGGARSEPLESGAQYAPGLLVYRFGAGLFYANATRFTEEIMTAVETATPPLRWLVLDAEAMGDIDYSGADSIRQIQEELARTGVTLAIAEPSDTVRSLLDAYGLTERIGPDNIHRTLRLAVEAYGSTTWDEPAASGSG